MNNGDATVKSIPNEPLVPFLKWAGGKRWFTIRHLNLVPEHYEKYFEPFLGSGAMYFALKPPFALLSDINSDLISCFQAVREAPRTIAEQLQKHHISHCSNYYYEMRSSKPEDSVERAAWLIYLNRTCWNGLYRVNRKNEFNVPIGSKIKVVLETDDFIGISKLLSRADIRCQDFEETLELTGSGDFVFIDPPYTVKHNLDSFIKYNDSIFSWADQIRLRDAVVRASSRGTQILVTNANHASVREIYCDVGKLDVVKRSSVLAADSAHRIQTEELVIRTWLKSGN